MLHVHVADETRGTFVRLRRYTLRHIMSRDVSAISGVVLLTAVVVVVPVLLGDEVGHLLLWLVGRHDGERTACVTVVTGVVTRHVLAAACKQCIIVSD